MEERRSAVSIRRSDSSRRPVIPSANFELAAFDGAYFLISQE